MKFMTLSAKYDKPIKLNEELLNKLKSFKKIGLYTSVQFLEQIENVVKELEKEGIKVISSTPSRTSTKYQILGCDCDYKNLKTEDVDAFLYIGDGLFHPKALLLAQRNQEKAKEVIISDPIAEKHKVLSVNEMEKVLKKYKGSLLKFMTSDKIGVLITTKAGQQQLIVSKELKEKYPDKKFYYFIDNNIDFNQFENFNFIQCWVNTACPRIGFEDNSEIKFSMINLNDALNVNEVMTKESLMNSL